MMVRKLGGKKVFLNFLFSYLAVAAIPILACLFFISETLNVLETNAIEEGVGILEQCRKTLDDAFYEIDVANEAISQDADIKWLLSRSSPYRDNSVLFKLSSMNRKVNAYYYNNSFVTDAYVYLWKSDVILSKDHVFLSTGNFYGSFFQYGDLNADEWRGLFKNQRHSKAFFPMAAVQAVGKRMDALMYATSFPYAINQYGSVIALIERDALVKRLESIYSVYGGGAVLLDANGEELLSYAAEKSWIDQLLLDTADSDGYMLKEIDGREMIVTYDVSAYNGVKYVALLPYESIFSQINATRHVVTFVLFVDIALSVAAAFLLAHNKSTPVRRLVGMLKDGLHAGAGDGDGYPFINKTVDNLILTNRELNESLTKQRPLLSGMAIDRMLMGGFKDRREIDFMLRQMDLPALAGPLLAVLLTASASGNEDPNSLIKEYGIIKVLIYNAFDKRLGKKFYYHDTDSQTRAFIIELPSGEPYRQFIERIIAEAMGVVSAKSAVRLTFAVGSPVESLFEISQSYLGAVEIAEYYSADERCVIWSEDVKKRAVYYYPINVETQLMNHVRTGNIAALSGLIDELYEENFRRRALPPVTKRHLLTDMRLTVMKLSDMLDIRLDWGEEARADDMDYSCQFHAVRAAIMELCAAVAAAKSERHNSTAEDVVRYLDENYADAQLSLSAVSEKFGLAGAYLSRMFKEHAGENFSTYLERKRIDAACALLQKGHSLEYISSKVGYSSAYVLRNAFKRVLGITPSEYRQAHK